MQRDKIIDHWDPIKYEKGSLKQRVIGRKLIESLNSFIRAKNILDLGSGTGQLTYNIQNIFNPNKIVGVDISPKMITYAKEKWANKGLDFIQSNILDIKKKIHKSRCYDLVVSFWALSWLNNPESLFKTIKTLQPPSGNIMLQVPKANFPLEFAIQDSVLQYKKYFEGIELPSLKNRITEDVYVKSSRNIDENIKVISCTLGFDFQEKKGFEDYIRGWLPHLSYIDGHVADDFIDALVSKYIDYNDDPYKIDYNCILVTNISSFAEQWNKCYFSCKANES